EFDSTTEGALCHRVDDRGAKAVSLRRSYWRSFALSLVHRETSPTTRQSTLIRPASVESALYFLALVATSWSASPMSGQPLRSDAGSGRTPRSGNRQDLQSARTEHAPNRPHQLPATCSESAGPDWRRAPGYAR